MTLFDLWAALRQLTFPPAFRINAIPDTRTEPTPGVRAQSQLEEDAQPASVQIAVPQKPDDRDKAEVEAVPDRVIAGVATCLWYIKTKFLKREWPSIDSAEEEPRVRKVLNQINKGIDILLSAGIEVQDPVNRRCPPGSENLMKPLGHQPTVGLSHERVAETVTPIVFRQDRLIQRAEVFVAVPEAESKPKTQADAVRAEGPQKPK